MSVKILIARYNEDVEWANQFPNVVIYNKGAPLANKRHPEHFLENVGREGHTYYQYICDNYDNLADHTIFLQGTPFDHSPNIIKNVQALISERQSMGFSFLSEDIHNSTLAVESRIDLNRNIRTTWKRIFGEDCGADQPCVFGAGAQFIVSKTNIQRHPKPFYENIVKILEYHINPDEGFDVERLHLYILG